MYNDVMCDINYIRKGNSYVENAIFMIETKLVLI